MSIVESRKTTNVSQLREPVLLVDEVLAVGGQMRGDGPIDDVIAQYEADLAALKTAHAPAGS